MWIFTIVRTFFDSQDNWERTVTADSFKVLSEAKQRMIDIIISSTGEHVGTYTLEYMENTNNIDDLHATIEYKDGGCEIIQVLSNWLE